MFAFIIRRIFQAVAVMAVVSMISFSLFNYVGDPVDNMVGQEATLEQRARIRDKLGLDDPFIVQYARFVSNAVQGEFGISYRIKRPVSAIIVERIPATIELVAVSAVIAFPPACRCPIDPIWVHRRRHARLFGATGV